MTRRNNKLVCRVVSQGVKPARPDQGPQKALPVPDHRSVQLNVPHGVLEIPYAFVADLGSTVLRACHVESPAGTSGTG